MTKPKRWGAEIYQKRKSLDSIKILLEKNPSKGISELIHHLEQHPDDVNAYYVYGKFHERNGNLKEAKDAYEIVASSTSKIRFAGIVGLASIAEKEQNIAKAEALYSKAIAENPNENPSTFYALAMLERRAKNYKKALDILNQVTPKTVTTQIEKLKVYNAKGDTAAVFNLANSIEPENAFQVRAIALEQAIAATTDKDYTAAEFYFLQAKDVTKKDDLYYKALVREAQMLIETNKPQMALDDCEELLQMNYLAYGHTYYIKGQAHSMLGDYKTAIDNYNKVLEGNRISLIALGGAQFSLGRLQLSMGDLAGAEKNLKASVETGLKAGGNPVNITITLLIGLYIRQGRYEDAKKVISKMQEEYSETANIQELNFAETLIAKLENQPINYLPSLSYQEKQVIDYKESEAIAHIKNHHMGGVPSTGNFFDSIDIRKLMEEIRPYLIEDNRVSNGLLNEYNIDYPNIGYLRDGTIINRLEVVVIPGTTNILTMHPDNMMGTSIRQIDIKRQIASTKSPEVSSAISKFNARFAKFVPPQSKNKGV